MKKLALLLAASLLSVPLIAATPTDTHAAAKAKTVKQRTNDPNLRFAVALSDLSRSLATYVHKPPREKGRR
jgi:hypothetical protein